LTPPQDQIDKLLEVVVYYWRYIRKELAHGFTKLEEEEPTKKEEKLEEYSKISVDIGFLQYYRQMDDRTTGDLEDLSRVVEKLDATIPHV
jgi:hypothetical protein